MPEKAIAEIVDKTDYKMVEFEYGQFNQISKNSTYA
jgi:hypothetical protein